MLEHGHNQTQNQLTLFAEDSRVRTFQTPASVPVLTEIVVDYSLKSSVSLAKFDPDSLSWRTSQLCLTGGLTEFSGNWPRSGLMLNGTAYQLPPLVPRTSVTGCLSSHRFPTPSSSEPGMKAERLVDKDGNTPKHFNQRLYDSETGRLCQKGLTQFVQMFPTPTASDWKRRGPNSRHQGLPEIVKNWPTPTSRDYKGGRKPETLMKSGRGQSNSLSDALTISGQYGQLNPTWVEWLMGFPSGWTDLDA